MGIIGIIVGIIPITPERPSDTLGQKGEKFGKEIIISDNAQADSATPNIKQDISAAMQFQRQKNNKEAIEKWRAVADVVDKTDDRNRIGFVAWSSIGYLHGEQLNYQKSIDAYDKAIQLKSHDARVYINRGNAKGELGRYKDAIADYDEAIRLKPNYAKAYFNRGVVKGRLEDFEDAIVDQTEAIRLKSGYAEAYLDRGNAKGGLGRYNDAIADYDEAIRLKSDHAKAYFNRAKILLTLGYIDKAREDFEKARTLSRAAGDGIMVKDVTHELERLNSR